MSKVDVDQDKQIIYSLVHNIELNKSDWWDSAIQRLIIATLWLASTELSPDELTLSLNENLHSKIDPQKILNQAKILCVSGTLLELPNGKLKIFEQKRNLFEAEIAKAEKIAEEARQKFFELVSNLCPELDVTEIWKSVNKDVFIPNIQEMGAKFYELITGDHVFVDGNAKFEKYLEKFADGIRERLKTAIYEYLSKKDSVVRSYFLMYLNTHFVLEASNLKEKDIARLSSGSELKPQFNIFADTNFIFSLFGVHDNPFNRDAVTLLDLIHSISDKVNVKLYINPITVDETKTAIQNSIDHYNNLRLSPNLAQASLATKNISGFLRKLAEESSKTGKIITAQDYYGPYKSDLVRILKASGIILFNEKMDQYVMRQDVIDDINVQLEFEKGRYGKDAKTYEKIKHDLTLWHFVKDKRPIVVESPTDAGYWIATLDFRFLGFDAYKQREDENAPPICLLPSQFVQILQFWSPRTEQFENALFETWIWPLLFQDFDPDAEKVTIRILESLSRYENFQDLPETTVVEILLNDALRERIYAEKNIANQVELVKEALIEQHKRTYDELEKVKDKVREADHEISELKTVLSDKELGLVTARRDIGERDEKIDELTNTVSKLSASYTDTQKALDAITAKMDEEENNKKTKKAQKEFVYKISLEIFLWVVFGVLVGYLVAVFLVKNYTTQIILSFATFSLVLWVWRTDNIGTKNEKVAKWHIFEKFHKLKIWFFSGLAAIGLILLDKVISEFVWEPLKKIFTR